MNKTIWTLTLLLAASGAQAEGWGTLTPIGGAEALNAPVPVAAGGQVAAKKASFGVLAVDPAISESFLVEVAKELNEYNGKVFKAYDAYRKAPDGDTSAVEKAIDDPRRKYWKGIWDAAVDGAANLDGEKEIAIALVALQEYQKKFPVRLIDLKEGTEKATKTVADAQQKARGELARLDAKDQTWVEEAVLTGGMAVEKVIEGLKPELPAKAQSPQYLGWVKSAHAATSEWRTAVLRLTSFQEELGIVSAEIERASGVERQLEAKLSAKKLAPKLN